MNDYKFKRIPKHIGIIPDGNRRWAQNNNLEKYEGYSHGVTPGFELYELFLKFGIKEATFYGFTQDNTKRPSIQKQAFIKSCIDAVNLLSHRDANLLVVGNTKSPIFPKELIPYTNKRIKFGRGLININFLVNYSWKWDINMCIKNYNLNNNDKKYDIEKNLASSKISRIDLIIRWGNRNRLSGFLPIQTTYSDFYFIDDYWPNFKPEHLYDALKWYQATDITLGG